jgi:hypothetical protein
MKELLHDDTQIYLSFHSTEAQLAKHKIEACICDISSWMSKNMLKMNRTKTELLVINAAQRPPPPIASVSV